MDLICDEMIQEVHIEIFSQIRYTITVQHGPAFEWLIKKRYKHFHDLHKALVHYVESETGRSVNSINKYDDHKLFFSLKKKRLNLIIYRSVPSEKATGNDEDHALIQKQEQPCFPTRNDRIAFIDRSSIANRCVSFVLTIFSFLLQFWSFYVFFYRKHCKII